MTTKTDFHSIRELKENFRPAERGFISGAEADMVRNALEISSRTAIELQNVRDMTVLLYSTWEDAAEKAGDTTEVMRLMDCMSAICCVIDAAKWDLGMMP